MSEIVMHPAPEHKSAVVTPGMPARPARRTASLRRTVRIGAGAELRLRGLRGDAVARRPLSEQCRNALACGASLLAGEGASFSDVVRVVYVLRRTDDFESCYPLLRAAFDETRPALALRVVAGFDDPDVDLELEMVAHLPE